MLDLAIVGATVVTPSGVSPTDLGVRAGKIVELSAPGALTAQASRTIDAAGMLLLPGAIDPHTHLDAEMFASRTADDFESGTIAASAGGVTSIIDYAFQPENGSLADAALKWDAKAQGRAVIDYGFHVAILDPTPEAIAEIPRIVDRGISSFKIFMMNRFEARVRDFMRAFRAAAEAGALLTIHAEDEHLIGYCTERLLAEGHRGVEYSRPAVRRSWKKRRSSGHLRWRLWRVRPPISFTCRVRERSMRFAVPTARAAMCWPRRAPSTCI